MANKQIIQFFTAIFIAVIWIVCDFINVEIFYYLKTDKYLYSIYLLAGLRLLAIILFGYVGFFGIFIGHAISSSLMRGFEPNEAIWLALLSSSATLIAYKLWQFLFGKTDSFLDISPLQLFYLVVLNAGFVAIFRFTYLLQNNEISLFLLYGTLAANISESLLVLYLIKVCSYFYRRLID
ncbi:hypothetical protein [Polynucleobacter necessarius]|uniref:hypothetical protein n=1 Tax=Polynucleobacter necessarius TaxID=576610 RepID=UPI000E095D24|nr:hypothetical protein [Polynucleobacter necessarius]